MRVTSPIFEITSRSRPRFIPSRLSPSSWRSLPRSSRSKIPPFALSVRRYSIEHHTHSHRIEPPPPSYNPIAYQDYRPRSFLEHWRNWNQSNPSEDAPHHLRTDDQKGKQRERQQVKQRPGGTQSDAIHLVDFPIFGEESILDLANYHDAQGTYLTEDLVAPPIPLEKVAQHGLRLSAEARVRGISHLGSSTQASTSSLDPLADFVDKNLLPRTLPRARQLVITAYEKRMISVLDRALGRLAEGPDRELESAALLALLEAKVEQDIRHAHVEREQARIRKPKNLEGFAGRTALPERCQISKDMFYRLWDRYWHISTLDMARNEDGTAAFPFMSQQQANHILRSILDTIPPSSRVKSSPSTGPLALRTLLIQSGGAAATPSLSLDTLAHFILPYASAQLPHLVDLPPVESATWASTNQSLLLLQDLLRAGVINAKAVKSSGITQILAKRGEMEESEFGQAVRQAILRSLLSAYSSRHAYHRTTLLVRYLHLNPDTTAQESDVRLVHSICREALQASKETGKWVQRVALLLSQQILGKTSAVPAVALLPQSEGHRLLDLFFETALLEEKVVSHGSRIKAPEASLVWKAIRSAELNGSRSQYRFQLSTLIPLLRAFSKPSRNSNAQAMAADILGEQETENEEQLRSFLAVLRQLKADTNGVAALSDSEKNDLLYTVLTSSSVMLDFRLEKMKLQNSLLFYESLLASDHYPVSAPSSSRAPFVLESRNLIPLLNLFRLCHDFKISGSSASYRELRQLSIKRIHQFLRDRARYVTLDYDDITVAARAFLLTGNRESGLQVLGAYLTGKKVPSLYPVQLVLGELAKDSPKIAVQLLEEAISVGLRPTMAIIESIVEHMPTNQGSLQAIEDLVDVVEKYGSLEVDEVERLERRAEYIEEIISSPQSQLEAEVQRLVQLIANREARDASVQSDSLMKTESGEMLNSGSSVETTAVEPPHLLDLYKSVNDLLQRCLKSNSYEAYHSLVLASAPFNLISHNSVLAYLSHLSSQGATSRNIGHSSLAGRNSLIVLLSIVKTHPELLIRTVAGQGSPTCYQQIRRLAIVYGDPTLARKAYEIAMQEKIFLSEDDIRVLRSKLKDDASEEVSKYLFDSELDIVSR